MVYLKHEICLAVDGINYLKHEICLAVDGINYLKHEISLAVDGVHYLKHEISLAVDGVHYLKHEIRLAVDGYTLCGTSLWGLFCCDYVNGTRTCGGLDQSFVWSYYFSSLLISTLNVH
jgi:hypothetical protein